MGEHRRLVVAVAALQGEDQRQALLEARHGGGIVVEVVDQGPHLGGDVLDLGVQAQQALGQGLEARIEAGQVARLPARGRDALARGGSLLAGPLPQQRGVDRRTAAGDRLAVPSGPQASLDLVGLADAQVSGRDLARLVLREVEPADQLAGIDRQLGQRGPVRPPPLDRPGDGLASHPRAAVGIEEVALDALVEEALLVVLAVDLDQPADRLGQTRGGHRLVVEARRGAAAGLDLADDDERLGQPLEQRLHPGPVRPVPDQPGVHSRTEGEPQRVDEQALAGAGLAGDDVEARCRTPDGPGR